MPVPARGQPIRRIEIGAERAGIALWLALIASALLRAALAFVPTMAGWGVNLLRFVAPIPGWALWTVAALPLIPAFGRRALGLCEAAGQALDRAPLRGAAVVAGFAAALVGVLPDRVHFVGDYLLRFGTAERALQPAALFPQALPLDVWLHYGVERWCVEVPRIDVNASARMLGALEAALFGSLAVAFARALELRGARGLAAVTIVLMGGTLGLYTGYGKAIAEVALLTLAFAVCALRTMRAGGGAWLAGALVALGFVLHRSTLGLLPALVLVLGVAGRAMGRGAWPRLALAVMAPLVTLAAMLPRILGTFTGVDRVHFTPPEVVRQGGILSAMFAGARPLDLASVVLLLSPLALVAAIACLVSPTWRAPGARRREGALLLLLALPWLAMLLLIHPPQGMFRDWDDFAAAATTFSMLAAWGIAGVLRAAPRRAWLAVPVILGAAAPSLTWLIHESDLERGLTRIERYLAEPPARSDEERAKTWDFLGIRNAQLGRWDRSAAAMANAAALAPSPRVLLQWASAEQASGAEPEAREVYERLVTVAPDEVRGWFGLAVASWRLGDRERARAAAQEVLRLRPGDPRTLRLLAVLAAGDSAARGDSAVTGR